MSDTQKIRYVGVHAEVELPTVGLFVQNNHTLEVGKDVDKDVAEQLVARGDFVPYPLDADKAKKTDVPTERKDKTVGVE